MLNEVSSATIRMPLTVAAAAQDERPRKGKGQQQQRRNPQCEEQQLPQPVPCRVLHRRVLQHLDRGELDACLRFALQQVQNDRHPRRDGAKQEQR